MSYSCNSSHIDKALKKNNMMRETAIFKCIWFQFSFFSKIYFFRVLKAENFDIIIWTSSEIEHSSDIAWTETLNFGSIVYLKSFEKKLKFLSFINWLNFTYDESMIAFHKER